MALSSLRRRSVAIALSLVVVVGLGIGAYLLWWPREPVLPAPGSPLYEEYVDAFQVGVAGLDSNRSEIALAKLTRAVELVPGEPAGWANRGLVHLRDGGHKLKEAARDLNKALELAPDNGEIEILLGFLEERRGRYSRAVAHLRKAVKERPQDLAARFKLARLIEKEKDPGSGKEFLHQMDEILKIQPNNLFVLKEKAGVAANLNDGPAFFDTLARFRKLSSRWSPKTLEPLTQLEKAPANALNKGKIPGLVVLFSNWLATEAGFTRGALAVNPTLVGRSLQYFLRLKPVVSAPAPPDLELTFNPRPFPNFPKGETSWTTVQPVWLTGTSRAEILAANGHEARWAGGGKGSLPFPGGPKALPPSASGVVALDWKNDFRSHILLAGAGGLRFFEQGEKETFSDVSGKTGLGKDVLNADYYGAWAVDADMDGDMDIIAAPRIGPPILLRNNGDGTFKPFQLFPNVMDVRGFVWADFDNDGAPDAAFLDAGGRVHIFTNERSGQFRARTPPDGLGKVLALAVADVNDDGVLDLIALKADGAVVRISDQDKGTGWEVAEIARWPDFPAQQEAGSFRLFSADLDNNGSLDLIVSGPSGTRIWLGNETGQLKPLAANLKQPVLAAACLDGKGRIDLLALDEDNKPVRMENKTTKDYSWQIVLPHAVKKGEVKGDSRINSFAIGSEIEIRAGMLVRKQMTSSPVAHFGLGRQKTNVIRFVLPNGSVQVEFEPKPKTALAVEQRLTSSCPFLFTDNGQDMQFVTDFMWSTPLGMYINAQDRGGFLQTEEWVKIPGNQLAPRDGYYDVRVTANLWEAHYYDYMAMIAVDHPPGTEIFVDERFPVVPMKPQVHVTDPPSPVARAWDDLGNDVTDVVRAKDGRYLDTFGKGEYQGVTRDHWVEVDLGADAPKEGPLWLLAHGWVHPTDSSINFALAQGKHDKPRALVLEVPDGRGGWKVARNDLGFPAGKNKTMMVRLDGIDTQGVARRFRLRTNMEIFWDALAYARGRAATQARQQRLSPTRAELRYRGFQRMTQARWSAPELPHYEPALHGQRYRDLIGYYTRFGDVRELLAKVDDRYVIMNAGDEIAMRFEVPPAPPRGWKRDFVWICDGWTKDGNLNTRFSKTVLPLPSHDLKTYDRPPGRLEDDPVYKRFPNDWQKFHTRYVTPSEFEQGLRTFRR